LNLDAVNKIYCTVMNQVDLWKLKTLMTFPRPNSNLPYGVTKIVEAFVELNEGADIEFIKSQIYQKLIIATINLDAASQAQKESELENESRCSEGLDEDESVGEQQDAPRLSRKADSQKINYYSRPVRSPMVKSPSPMKEIDGQQEEDKVSVKIIGKSPSRFDGDQPSAREMIFESGEEDSFNEKTMLPTIIELELDLRPDTARNPEEIRVKAEQKTQNIIRKPKYVDNIIKKPIYIENIIERPVENIIEKIVYVDKIIEVPIKKIRYSYKKVPIEKIIYHTVDQIVEHRVERKIEKIKYVENIIKHEYPEEHHITIPLTITKEIPIYKTNLIKKEKIVPIIVNRQVENLIEKIVEVPIEKIVEIDKEVIIERPINVPKITYKEIEKVKEIIIEKPVIVEIDEKVDGKLWVACMECKGENAMLDEKNKKFNGELLALQASWNASLEADAAVKQVNYKKKTREVMKKCAKIEIELIKIENAKAKGEIPRGALREKITTITYQNSEAKEKLDRKVRNLKEKNKILKDKIEFQDKRTS
jgi:hypothetical protein